MCLIQSHQKPAFAHASSVSCSRWNYTLLTLARGIYHQELAFIDYTWDNAWGGRIAEGCSSHYHEAMYDWGSKSILHMMLGPLKSHTMHCTSHGNTTFETRELITTQMPGLAGISLQSSGHALLQETRNSTSNSIAHAQLREITQSLAWNRNRK